MGGGEDIQQLTIRVPRDVHEALANLALATGRPVGEHVEFAVRDYLETQGHYAAVMGFTRRAQQRYRISLDKLAGS